MGVCGGNEERSFAGTPNFTADPPAGWEELDEDEREQVGKGTDALTQELERLPEEMKDIDVAILAVWTEPTQGIGLPAEISVTKDFLPGGKSEQEYVRVSEQGLEAFDASDSPKRQWTEDRW